MDIVKQFNDYRTKMNEKIADADNLIIKRTWIRMPMHPVRWM
jgi:hypothetical protein